MSVSYIVKLENTIQDMPCTKGISMSRERVGSLWFVSSKRQKQRNANINTTPNLGG